MTLMISLNIPNCATESQCFKSVQTVINFRVTNIFYSRYVCFIRVAFPVNILGINK